MHNARRTLVCCLLLVPLSVLALGACGTEAMGTDTCRKIEQARCRKGPVCPALGVQAGTGVEECIQFARDRCLHGLAVADPGAAAVDKCVAAIDQASSCNVVVDPTGSAACAFLLPGPVDDADANVGSDAGSDASTGSDNDG